MEQMPDRAAYVPNAWIRTCSISIELSHKLRFGMVELMCFVSLARPWMEKLYWVLWHLIHLIWYMQRILLKMSRMPNAVGRGYVGGITD